MPVDNIKSSLLRKSRLELEQIKKAKLDAHRLRGFEVAQKAAEILREEFNVRRVVLFGSLLHPENFRSEADIDLVVWGLDHYHLAMARLVDMDIEFNIDIFQGEFAKPWLRILINKEGVKL
jgi:predicted nucleotidyltransferase